MKTRRCYNLPTIPRLITYSSKEYVDEWHKLGNKLKKLLPPGYRIIGYDPGFLVGNEIKSIDFPLEVVLHLTRKMKK